MNSSLILHQNELRPGREKERRVTHVDAEPAHLKPGHAFHDSVDEAAGGGARTGLRATIQREDKTIVMRRSLLL
jgi:hypothetical protein